MTGIETIVLFLALILTFSTIFDLLDKNSKTDTAARVTAILASGLWTVLFHMLNK